MIETTVDIIHASDSEMTIVFPVVAQDAWLVLREKLKKKRINQVYLKMGMPRKPRTTGEGSQNHHLNGHIQQIAQHTGEDFATTKWQIKQRALNKGYPFDTGKLGVPVPRSESVASTVECGYLIDECHEVASWLGVKLREV